MEEQKDARQQDGLQYKEKIQSEIDSQTPAEVLKASLEQLQSTLKMESFDFIANLVEGAENLNPEKKARKKIFLSESTRKKERKDLKNKLKLWVDVLTTEGDLYSMVESAEKSYEETKNLYQENLSNAVETVKDLERSYRSVALFYRNTEEDKTKLHFDHECFPRTDHRSGCDCIPGYDRTGVQQQIRQARPLRKTTAFLSYPDSSEASKNIAEWGRRANKIQGHACHRLPRRYV